MLQELCAEWGEQLAGHRWCCWWCWWCSHALFGVHRLLPLDPSLQQRAGLSEQQNCALDALKPDGQCTRCDEACFGGGVEQRSAAIILLSVFANTLHPERNEEMMLGCGSLCVCVYA